MLELIKRIFLWIYCMDFYEAVLLLVVTAGAYRYLKIRYSGRPWWKGALAFVLVLWFAALIAQTLLQRTPGPAQEPQWRLFQSYLDAFAGEKELLRSNFMNAVLFCPAGFLTAELLPERWKNGTKLVLILLVFTLVSGAIEWAQLRYGLGLSQTDDVIHNSLGALLGAWASGAVRRLSEK